MGLLEGSEASFYIYYWGIRNGLPSNLVHKHSFFEICYIIGGSGTYTEEGVDYPLGAGTHLCSRPERSHQIRTSGLDIVYVAFELDEARSSPEIVAAYRELAAEGLPLVHSQSQTPTAYLWESLLLRDEHPFQLPAVARRPLAHALLLSFPAQFRKHAAAETPPRSGASNLLQQAKLFIRDNLATPLSLGKLASYLNVSERHLSRLFVAGTGMNFTDYIRLARINQAERLLAESELSIADIAEATGFSSVHYFTRTFQRMKHLPPGRFRTVHCKQAQHGPQEFGRT